MLEDRTTAVSPGTPWPAAYPRGYAVVDVETTGLARDDRIISAAVYRLDERGEIEDHWYTLVNPERDPGPVWIHGLTSETLEGAPLFPDIAEEFAARLDGRVLVAHNAVFDWQMIAREYARARREAPVRQRLCTIALAKELDLPLPNHKLETLAERTIWAVPCSHGASPAAPSKSRVPPHRSTTRCPSRYTATAAPRSPSNSKLLANASLTGSKPSATVPCTSTSRSLHPLAWRQ